MQCTAHKRDGSGDPCTKHAVKGATVCASHGAAAPQVRAAASRRLLEAADPVTAELVQLALHAEDPKVRLQACRDVLDRVGVTTPKVVEVISMDLVEREIARLEAELADNDAGV